MHSSQHEIIGGVFGLEPVSLESNPLFSNSNVSYFLNARCAVYAICQSVKPGTAWLPSYLCSAILEPLVNLGVRVRYYDNRPNVQTDMTDWIVDVSPGDLVLIIHYFGFRNTVFAANRLKNRGAVIIEDASQGLFVTQHYSESACIIYSARKFLGVPDGGLMVCSPKNGFDFSPLEPPPADWWKLAFDVTRMRRNFDLLGGENRWYPLFRYVEDTFPLGPYRSSDLAKTLIESGTDYKFIRKTRRENYLVLLERLREFAVFGELDEETVPLGFPVCVKAGHRDRVLKLLYSRRIYAPVHWRIEGIVPQQYRDSHLLSQRILTLICDQRYTVHDMTRQADAFLAAIKLT